MHHKMLQVRAGERAPQKREPWKAKDAKGEPQRLTGGTAGERTAPTRAAGGHGGAVEHGAPAVRPVSIRPVRRERPPRTAITHAGPGSQPDAMSARTRGAPRTKAQPDAAALHSDASACYRNSAKPHAARLPSSCSLASKQVDQLEYLTILKPHGAYKAILVCRDLYDGSSLDATKHLSASASVNDGILRADSPTRDKEGASTRGREAGLEGGKRGWIARGSSGGKGVAVNARRSVATAVARVEAHAKGCEIRNTNRFREIDCDEWA
ncbi:hypothetical protein BJ912DRAFT_1133986 [Pholiota molesta]|nr:hypothetical protein BJ912DRAFT_1133986 [Pholiota molesta]